MTTGTQPRFRASHHGSHGKVRNDNLNITLNNSPLSHDLNLTLPPSYSCAVSVICSCDKQSGEVTEVRHQPATHQPHTLSFLLKPRNKSPPPLLPRYSTLRSLCAGLSLE
jgi:hypothetical protein